MQDATVDLGTTKHSLMQHNENFVNNLNKIMMVIDLSRIWFVFPSSLTSIQMINTSLDAIFTETLLSSNVAVSEVCDPQRTSLMCVLTFA